MRHQPLNRRLFTFGLIAMFAGFAFFAAGSAQALTIVPQCARVNANDPPSLACALLTFTNVASLIVGVTGSFALLMFVYGGFLMLTSGGNDEKVKKGKETLKNALIGIVLIFTAGYIIDYAVSKLTGGRRTTSTTGSVDCATVADEGYVCLNNPGADANCSSAYTCTGGRQCCIPAETPSTTP